MANRTAFVEKVGAESSGIYIGRSSFPERRLLEHFLALEATHLAVLHWTCSSEEIVTLEKRLIRAARKRFPEKKWNVSAESYGRWDGPWNAIYAAWAWKNDAVPVLEDPTHPLESLFARPLAPSWGFAERPPVLELADGVRRGKLDVKAHIASWYQARTAARVPPDTGRQQRRASGLRAGDRAGAHDLVGPKRERSGSGRDTW